jgi:hypothetical protein
MTKLYVNDEITLFDGTKHFHFIKQLTSVNTSLLLRNLYEFCSFFLKRFIQVKQIFMAKQNKN